MPRIESVISPGPAGAGRKRDFTFPDWCINMSGGPSNLERDRPGGSNGQSGSQSSGTTGALVLGVALGVPCLKMTNGVNLNGGPVYTFDGGGRLLPSTVKTKIHFTNATDDFAVYRVYAMMRVIATPTDATDMGLQIVLGPNAAAAVLSGATPGWAIQFDNTGGCSLVQHGNSGAVTSVVLQSAAQGFVNTAWNMFEFRLISATRNADGSFKCFLNNQLKVTRSFSSVPDDLPIPSSPGANVNNGYVVHAIAFSRNSELDVGLMRSQVAPTEAGLF